MKKIYTIIFLTLILLYGCSRTVPNSQTAPETKNVVSVQESEIDKEPIVQDIDEDIKELDNLEKELSDSDLDDLDQELADINW